MQGYAEMLGRLAHRCEWQYAMPCSIWYRYNCRGRRTPSQVWGCATERAFSFSNIIA